MLTSVLLAALLAAPDAKATPPDFSADVRPILSQHCFKCHGPDETHREGSLRFDDRAVALKGGDSGEPAIVPNHPDKSELIRRISSTDESEVMPPAAAKMPLTPEQIDVLTRWIASGAEYKTHWAFQKPEAVRPPRVKSAGAVRNPIDRFIVARLEAEGLAPSPEADRETLIRRLSFDLLGLPPTREEVAEFLADSQPAAYERLVERYLASPRYGERWARRWLDLARYADTNGYEKDRQRSIWPYRDWVIRALNADEPFDQFTIDQLAGDLLPNATEDQRIATGFHRNTMLNEEGGIDPLEFRFYAMTDRVGTTGTTWLGLTVMCAQCHTHKFDPIPHREYYEFLACLNNADELKRPVADVAIAAQQAAIDRQIADAQQALPSKFPLPADDLAAGQDEAARREANLNRSFETWIQANQPQAVEWIVPRPTKMESGVPHLEVQPDGSILASGDQTKRDVYTLHYGGDLEGVTALRLEALPDPSLPHGGPGRTYYEGPEGEFVLSEFVVTDQSGNRVILKDGGASNSGLNDRGESDARFLVDGDFQTSWTTAGRIGQPSQAVLRFAEPLKDVKSLTIEMTFERYFAAALGKFRIALTKAPGEVRSKTYTADVETVLRKPEAEWAAAERELVFNAFLNEAPELAEARKSIADLKGQRPEFPTSLVFQERPADNPRETKVHHRGEFLSTEETVQPGTLSALNPFPQDTPHNRLGFAEWLMSRDNPLTARVTVNRHWQALFGTGLVRTTGDFGYQGELPSHPELLDWLAIDFMRDWSVKRLHRQIVTSATYRQSSRASQQLEERDPGNRLLGRGPRVRIEAESVRDTALRVAGLLSGKMYGPSVFPPQPASVTTEGAYGQLAWTVSPGEDRYRRGLYTFMKRTAPYAMFTTFDGPSGEACLARRDVSNTPLQALTLLNDQSLMEAAQALGREAVASSSNSDEERIRWMIETCLARSPGEKEIGPLVKFVQSARARFTASPELASALIGPDKSDAAEVATWTAVARAVLNLDEFVTKE
jgi:hypothetical protein